MNDEIKPLLTEEHLQKGGLRLLAETLITLPYEAHVAREQLTAARRKLDDLSFQKKQIEREVYAAVAQETVVIDEKRKPAFSNEKARESETASRCERRKDYAQIAEEETVTLEKYKDAELRLAYLKDVYNHAKLLVKILTNEED